MVEQRVDPFLAQRCLGVVGTTDTAAREEMHRELRIITRK
jgi:hypothetical protein